MIAMAQRMPQTLTARIKGKSETCSDGVDNDSEEFIDCADPDCAGNSKCK